jgi:hypothetical protein
MALLKGITNPVERCLVAHGEDSVPGPFILFLGEQNVQNGRQS